MPREAVAPAAAGGEERERLLDRAAAPELSAVGHSIGDDLTAVEHELAALAAAVEAVDEGVPQP